MTYPVKLLMSEFVTHDVKRFIVERPPNLNYEPGQGVELAINDPKWKNAGRAFTPASLKEDKVLEFVIKRYSDHHGITDKLHTLKAGAELLVSDSFGTLTYQGPGVFIAGGSGITPFLAMIRQLSEQGSLTNHTLIFTNKSPADIICEKELRFHFKERCILTCTDSSSAGYNHRLVTKEFLKEKISDFSQRFYTCGPPPFMKAVNQALTELGVSPDALLFDT
ncbi:FAD-binding oxidoreductase [Candidatus Nitrosacidococcus sp. I8]|uniref:FAD-binding oxidoreductase n=1 Tax=Candidatus Nitrosacidococcus sp. I8 TaxID=2942908 RepID=UPI0022268120|nr:FAD-binding oxidoreductase [Candidatus Nitrosacidococcus sp. I8]CAH9018066.1 Naphthalene 1,2-dioxygenase/salicylate 5-hydroxylase systems, ferredoxin--NAD(P)(+), reductase component [Candidatus Nitrosacidococcus sp. I8]